MHAMVCPSEDRDILSWPLTYFKPIESFTAAVYADIHNADVNWLKTPSTKSGGRTREAGHNIYAPFAHNRGTGDAKYAGGPLPLRQS
ncbi:hypothetical protein GALMADRAFT_239670 [Galerina marginata CBS 339.88]|uniref:Uncharacterized protein n=1 Tax=Galerina marginata (strain CBS 339.88) TaxID=685588 RepID=A0A067TEN5_GALM3|nr:hypothetical protein GALMADRAFT_239670 [Galerina marginata CBS 339.88]